MCVCVLATTAGGAMLCHGSEAAHTASAVPSGSPHTCARDLDPPLDVHLLFAVLRGSPTGD